ncbi:hypothetical protein SDC9_40109 [bioreactor metagenome]|uniref:Uncharacterized protein n=1 Tax=bioreactor metagenome TaxID=1076179 RepID=A0A644VRF3_9ZZZZ
MRPECGRAAARSNPMRPDRASARDHDEIRVAPAQGDGIALRQRRDPPKLAAAHLHRRAVGKAHDQPVFDAEIDPVLDRARERIGRPLTLGRQRDHLGAQHHRHRGGLCWRARIVAGQAGLPARPLEPAQARLAPRRAAQQVRLADEIGDEFRVRPGVKLLRRADLGKAAGAEDGDAIGHHQRLFLIVGHRDHRRTDLARDVHDLDLHLPAQLLVERRHRLVKEHDIGVEDERARERHALLLAARHLLRETFGEIGQPDDTQHLARPRFPLGALHAASLERIGDVFEHGHVREKRIVLEHHADVAPLRGDAGHVAPVDQKRAAARLDEARDHPQSRRLARTGRPEHGQELALPQLEGNVVERPHLAVVLAHLLELQRLVHKAHRSDSFRV